MRLGEVRLSPEEPVRQTEKCMVAGVGERSVSMESVIQSQLTVGNT